MHERHAWNAVLAFVARQGKIEKVEEIVNKMERSMMPVGADTLSHLIDGLVIGGVDMNLVKKIIENIASKASLSRTSSSSKRDMNDENDLAFDSSGSSTLKADLKTHNIIIRNLALAGAYNGAYMKIKNLNQEAMKPNVVSFSSLLSSQAKQGDWKSVEKTWNTMLSTGIVPTEHEYNLLVKYKMELALLQCPKPEKKL